MFLPHCRKQATITITDFLKVFLGEAAATTAAVGQDLLLQPPRSPSPLRRAGPSPHTSPPANPGVRSNYRAVSILKGQATPHQFNPCHLCFHRVIRSTKVYLWWLHSCCQHPLRVLQNFLAAQASHRRGRCSLPRAKSLALLPQETPRAPAAVGEEVPPAHSTYQCRSCRKRPAGGWGRKYKPPSPSPAGSSCRGTRRGSSATPSCCLRGVFSSLLRSRRAAAGRLAWLGFSLSNSPHTVIACLSAFPLSRWPRQRSLHSAGQCKPEGTAIPRLTAAEGSDECRTALRCDGLVRGVIASIAPSRAPGAPPPPTNGSPALPHRRERPAGRGGAAAAASAPYRE